MHILLIDQNKDNGRRMTAWLRRKRISAEFVNTVETAFDFCREEPFHVILLGEEILYREKEAFVKELRNRNIYTPVLMITQTERERIAGLQCGADDCISMPFSQEELLARIQALSRRSESYQDQKISFGNTTLDCRGYELYTDTAHQILSNKEYQLLELFMRHPRTVYSPDVLFHNIWEAASETNLDVIRTYIGYLRRILEKLDSDLKIYTVRGAGYMMTFIREN